MAQSSFPDRFARPAAHRTIRSADRQSRILEREGRQWFVFEHRHPFDRRSTPDLVFESDVVVRRVRNYPAHWASLPDESLWALYENR